MNIVNKYVNIINSSLPENSVCYIISEDEKAYKISLCGQILFIDKNDSSYHFIEEKYIPIKKIDSRDSLYNILNRDNK